MHKELFNQIKFGGMQSHGSIAALPVLTPANLPNLIYLTLSEAISSQLIRIEEVSESGSVPELRVISTAEVPVLIISGEEVKGARQNRILNTSILVPRKNQIIIPVSCTERGRWSYTSPEFTDSGNISSHDVRMSAHDSVQRNLEIGRGHRSDQGKVWDKIEELHSRSKSDDISHTRAMDDAFKARKNDLDEAQRHFSLIPGQTGILFFNSGKVAGLDLLSSPAALARLHEKLVRSYIIDFLEERKVKYEYQTIEHKARIFLENAATAVPKAFKSPGLGNDHRITTPAIQGAILEYEQEIIHACCFRVEAEKENMAGFRQRRGLF
jgi:hypothetical protein